MVIMSGKILIIYFVFIFVLVQLMVNVIVIEAKKSSQDMTIIFNRTDNCTLIIKNENDYIQFLKSQCYDINLNESLIIPWENLTSFFVPSDENRIVNYKMNKNGTNSCVVGFNCKYVKSFSEELHIIETVSVTYIPYTVQLESSEFNILDFSEYKPKIELKDIKIDCAKAGNRTVSLVVNNYTYQIGCEGQPVLISFDGNPFWYPFDKYIANIGAEHLDLSQISQEIGYENSKHNFLEIKLEKQKDGYQLTIQRKFEEKYRVLIGMILSFIFLALLVKFSEKKLLEFVFGSLFAVFFLGSFLNSFAIFKIWTVLFFVFFGLFISFIEIWKKKNKKKEQEEFMAS